MARTRSHKQKIFCHSLNFILILLAAGFQGRHSGYAQESGNSHQICFISDFQAPVAVEKIALKPYRNEDARDSLFAGIIRRQPGYLFMTGDLTSTGSHPKAWLPLDNLLDKLKKSGTSVYAVPGNHEYLYKSSTGMQLFKQRFPAGWLTGYLITVDSIAVVMINSNFGNLTKEEFSKQLNWYKSAMDSLETDKATRAIMVCTHHAPYSNSKAVGSSESVQSLIVPAFEKCKKSVLFISGHSHNLEYFARLTGKHYIVIGGGGGLTQPLIPMDERIYQDLLKQEEKPIYFYLMIEKTGNYLKLKAIGFKKDFQFFEYDIGTINIRMKKSI